MNIIHQLGARVALPLLLIVATPSLLIAKSAGYSGDTITIDHLMALKSVRDPQISPEGDWVAYTVGGNDQSEGKDKKTSQIFMVSTDGGAVLPMSGAGYSASSPRWSPDGKYLAYLAAKSKEDKSQVWTLDRRGGEARQYTDVPQGVSKFAWSPDGAQMLLLIKDQSAGDAEDAERKKEGKKAKPRPWVIDRLEFKADYVGYLDRTRTHIYVTAERMAAPRQITFGDYDDSDPAWSPNGTEIAFASNRTEEPDLNYNSDIWIVPTNSKKKTPKLRQLTTNPGADRAPAWSHDGATIAFVTVTDVDAIWYATEHLAVIDAAGGAPRLLTEALDRNVGSPRFSPGDKALYFGLEDSAEVHLARIDLASGEITRPVGGHIAAGAFTMNNSGAIALLISSPGAPNEVFSLDGDGPRQLTHTNADVLDDLKLAKVHNITFASADGTEIEGFIFTPPGYKSKKRTPTLLRIHGGPVAQFDFRFNNDAQLFAAAGYVVVMVNPRGSSGYGQAFSQALFADWGNKDYQDVMAAVDYAIAEGYADKDQLGVGGWSYGGMLTDYVITKTDRFKGAVTGASEVLYAANYGHDIYQKVWEAELGLPWENREAWERISPFNQIGNITTPTLIMGGKEDWNVPIMNSEQLYQALKRRGIDTELVVYPGEFHGFRRPSFIRDRYERYLDWYDRTVRGN